MDQEQPRITLQEIPDFSEVRDALARETEAMCKQAKERETKTADLLLALADDRQDDFARLKTELTGGTDDELKFRFSSPMLCECTVPLREGWDYSRINFKNVKFEGSGFRRIEF